MVRSSWPSPRNTVNSQTPTAGYLAIPGGPALVDNARDGFGEGAVTPEGAVRYAVSEQASAYLRYARGFKNGGFDADLGLRPQSQPHRFGQETVSSYELGAKTLWLEQRLRADFDVFLADYRDYQVTQYVQNGMLFLPVTSNASIAALTALWGLLASFTGPRMAIAIAGVLLLATPLLLPRRDPASSQQREHAPSLASEATI